jgi:hypothetical protein
MGECRNWLTNQREKLLASEPDLGLEPPNQRFVNFQLADDNNPPGRDPALSARPGRCQRTARYDHRVLRSGDGGGCAGGALCETRADRRGV